MNLIFLNHVAWTEEANQPWTTKAAQAEICTGLAQSLFESVLGRCMAL
jgi:hypothetical protein